MMKLTIEVKNLKDVFNLPNLETPAMKAAATEMEAAIKKHFDTRQSSWQPLTEADIKERERQGYGAGPILVKSGNLRDSLAVQGYRVEDSGTVATVYSDSPEAEAEDEKRSFYDMDPGDWDNVVNSYAAAFMDAWAKSK